MMLAPPSDIFGPQQFVLHIFLTAQVAPVENLHEISWW